MPLSPTPPIRSGYGDPRTPHGVSLAGRDQESGLRFGLHEVGWLPNGLRWYFPRVLSPFWRLYHNPRPGWRVVHRGRVWPLDPTVVLLIPDGQVFDCEGEAGVPHLWIHFSLTSPLARTVTEPVCLPVTSVLSVMAGGLIGRIEARQAPGPLAHAAAALLHAAFADFDPMALATHPPKLAAVLESIQSGLSGDLSNPVLARRAGLSDGAFLRWFQAAMGSTPASYVQRTRMTAAARALLTSPCSIDAIAASVGFKNRHHFSRVFARYFHCGPAAYRKGRA